MNPRERERKRKRERERGKKREVTGRAASSRWI